ncbi:MAG: hypothetical protein HYW27_01150 [Candidatus Aenigmarchaeota archaeon]|nr:hypothetical protein [Candidatus Aenigmarchaeota archaeon]
MKYYILLILALLFAAGCVSQAKNPNNGIVINEFTADPKVAEYGDTVRFFLDGENIGGTTADCVTTELFGLEGGWTDIAGVPFSTPFGLSGVAGQSGVSLGFQIFGFNIHRINGQWGGSFGYGELNPDGSRAVNVAFEGGDFSVSASGYSITPAIQNSFGQFVSQSCAYISTLNTQRIKVEPFLSPPLPERNKPGQSFTADWTLKPPLLPEGLKVDYPVTARTSFFYTSNAQVNIPAYSKAEYKRRHDIGEITDTPLSIVNTHAAPIQVSISRGASPMVISTDMTFTPVETFNYLIELQNVGQGYPLPFSNIQSTAGAGDPGVESGFVIATMQINGPGARFSDCLDQSGTEVFITPYVADLVKLRSDGKAPFGCKVVVDKAAWQTTPVGTVSITFEIFYRYYVDKHTTVSVIGPSRS